MKKLPTIIIVVLIALILFVSFKKKEPKLDDIKLDDGFSQVDVKGIGRVQNEMYEADFASCTPDDSFELDLELSKVTLRMVGVEKENCLFETSYRSAGGSYVNECSIPISEGKVTFTRENFENISKYCKIKNTGTGILELN